MLDRAKGHRGGREVVHGEEDASTELDEESSEEEEAEVSGIGEGGWRGVSPYVGTEKAVQRRRRGLQRRTCQWYQERLP